MVLNANIDVIRGLHKNRHGVLLSTEVAPNGSLVPKVAFDNGIVELVQPHMFKQPLAQLNGYTPIDPDYVTVMLVPLALGKWMTLTKFIGCEFDHVKLMLTSSQLWSPLAFIGLSRVKNFAGCFLPHGFQIGSIGLDKKCLDCQRGWEQRMDDMNIVMLRDPAAAGHTTVERCGAMYADIDDADCCVYQLPDAENPNLQVKGVISLMVSRKKVDLTKVSACVVL